MAAEKIFGAAVCVLIILPTLLFLLEIDVFKEKK